MWLLIVGLLFLGTSLSKPGGNQHHAKPHQLLRSNDISTAPNQQASPQILHIVVEQAKNSAFRDPQWWAVIVNGVVALATLSTLLFFKRQLGAAMDTERAVLVPMWQRFADKGSEHRFEWRFQNCGKTPAFITSLVGRICLVDDVEAMAKVPDYSGSIQYFGDPLLAGQMQDRDYFVALDNENTYESSRKAFREQGRVLYAYGRVLYKDIFGKIHETRFGVRYICTKEFSSEEEWRVAGSAKYNLYR